MTTYEQPSAPLGFQSLPAADKLSWFEEQFEATAYTPVTRPDLAFPPKRQLAKVLAVVMCPRRLVQTLDRTDDLMDPARPKVIHTQGAVACIAITIGAFAVIAVTVFSAGFRLDWTTIDQDSDWSLGVSIPYQIAPVAPVPVVDLVLPSGLSVLVPVERFLELVNT